MKIREAYTSALAGVGRTRRRRATSGATEVSAVGGVDEVQVSSQGLEVQRARLLALQAPEIRETLVREVLREIDEGRYVVTGADVLPKMIREHLEMAH